MVKKSKSDTDKDVVLRLFPCELFDSYRKSDNCFCIYNEETSTRLWIIIYI